MLPTTVLVHQCTECRFWDMSVVSCYTQHLFFNACLYSFADVRSVIEELFNFDNPQYEFPRNADLGLGLGT